MEPTRFQDRAPECLDLPFELKSVTTLRRDDGAEIGVFEGLASTFGNRDRLGDVIAPGAFRASLARPERIKMLWQHDARAPIGIWERIAETPAGLAVKGRLVLEVQRAREALALLRAGAVDALSIGFSVPRDGASVERDTAQRRISAVDLWEISVVTFPANPEARISRVKARPGAAALPSTLPPGPTATYTFGSPRVGNRAFAAGLRDLYRIVHGDDIAPKYPLPLGYCHGGEAWRLDADGSLRQGGSMFDQLIIPLTGKGIAKGVLDHRIGAYARKLARSPALSRTS